MIDSLLCTAWHKNICVCLFIANNNCFDFVSCLKAWPSRFETSINILGCSFIATETLILGLVYFFWKKIVCDIVDISSSPEGTKPGSRGAWKGFDFAVLNI